MYALLLNWNLRRSCEVKSETWVTADELIFSILGRTKYNTQAKVCGPLDHDHKSATVTSSTPLVAGAAGFALGCSHSATAALVSASTDHSSSQRWWTGSRSDSVFHFSLFKCGPCADQTGSTVSVWSGLFALEESSFWNRNWTSISCYHKDGRALLYLKCQRVLYHKDFTSFERKGSLLTDEERADRARYYNDLLRWRLTHTFLIMQRLWRWIWLHEWFTSCLLHALMPSYLEEPGPVHAGTWWLIYCPAGRDELFLS